MAKIDFPKKQEQRLIPKYLLEYSEELAKNHPDPSAEWGSSGPEYTAGNGIEINEDTISIDSTVVATKNDIPDVSEFITDDDLSEVLEDYELKSEAFSGSYNDLTDKPTIPTKTSDLQNDSGFITGVTWNDVTNKPTFATVATSGDYNDLLNKPTIPTVPTDVSAFNNDAGYITGIDSSDVITALGYTPGTSNFSGSYTDLTDKPTIPTVNNNTITITQGGVTKGSFTLNQNTNQTIALDAGGSGGVQLVSNSMVGLVTEATDGTNKPSISISSLVGTPTTYKLNLPEKNGTVATLDDIPTVPTNVSAFTNDAGYITNSALNDYVTTNTIQNITGKKTFVGSKLVNFKLGSSESDPAGFTCYTNANVERANLQFGKRTVSNVEDYYLTLGNYSPASSKTKVGFRLQPDSSSNSYNFLMPSGTNTNFTSAGYTTSANNYIPCAFKNGSTVVNANNYGLVDLSSLMPTVPTNISSFNNDSGYITGIDSSMVITALGYTPGTSNFSGSYSDLTNKPTIPTVTNSITQGSTDAVTSGAVYSAIGDIETLLAAI